jgi:hypothetical protein
MRRIDASPAFAAGLKAPALHAVGFFDERALARYMILAMIE